MWIAVAEAILISAMNESSDYILDHPLCAECGLCCLPWQHKPGAPAHYPCAHLTEHGCELSADARPLRHPRESFTSSFAIAIKCFFIPIRSLGDAREQVVFE